MTRGFLTVRGRGAPTPQQSRVKCTCAARGMCRATVTPESFRTGALMDATTSGSLPWTGDVDKDAESIP